MDIKECIHKNYAIYKRILNFIEDEYNIEENYQNLILLLNDYKINDDIHELQLIICLLSDILNNHHRSPSFFDKIKQILMHYKTEIKKYFTDLEIFNFFKTNQIIILFLIEEEIILVNQTIANIIINNQFSDFLYPEIKQFQKIIPDLPDNFYEKRRIGENDQKLCEIIRKDSVDELISYNNEFCINNSNRIETSIFETNSFLIENKNSTLIEYAAFHGSVEIFKLFYMNDFVLNPSIWLYAIHGNNLEIIHFLEKKNIKPNDESFNVCLEESIKCHHNEISKYIINNLMDNSFIKSCLENDIDNNILSFCFHYHNFELLPDCFDNKFIFFYLCQYNYVTLVKLLLKAKKLNLNEKIILTIKNFYS